MLSTNSDAAGAPIHAYTIIDQLRHDFQFVAVFGKAGIISEKLGNQNIPTYIIPQIRSRISPIKDLIALFRLIAIIKRENPDLLHCHSTKAGMLGRLAALACNKPCLFTVHGWGWKGMGSIKRRIIMLIEWLLPRLSRKFYNIYVARSVESEGQSVLGLPQTKGCMIYNGMPDMKTDDEPNASSRLVVLMIARVSQQKDHATLIEAFERTSLDADLWLCGEGTDHADFINQTKALAPTKHNRLRYMGVQTNIPQLLSQVQIVALISNFEGLPLSVIEAMSAGKAIIATDVDGIRELIEHERSGILVEKNNASAVAKALDRMSAPGIRESLGEAARSFYEKRFTLQTMIRQIESRYNTLLHD